MAIKSWQVIMLVNVYTCNCRRLEGKVVGGRFAAIYQFPHSVYVLSSCGDSSWTCGSSIVTQSLLLSAAHCFAECSAHYHVDAYAGTADIEHANYMRLVKMYIIHENFDPMTALCDISLMKLKSPLILGETTKRVIIRPSFPPVCEADMAGWGDISDDGTSTFLLKVVHQKVRPSPKCGTNKSYLKVRSGMMCVTSDNPDAYPASGDSGSALVTKDYQQIGIVSSKAQGPHISSVIYTNVSFFYNWIKDGSQLLYCKKSSKKVVKLLL